MVKTVTIDQDMYVKCEVCPAIEAADDLLWDNADHAFCSRYCQSLFDHTIFDADFQTRADFEDMFVFGEYADENI